MLYSFFHLFNLSHFLVYISLRVDLSVFFKINDVEQWILLFVLLRNAVNYNLQKHTTKLAGKSYNHDLAVATFWQKKPGSLRKHPFLPASKREEKRVINKYSGYQQPFWVVTNLVIFLGKSLTFFRSHAPHNRKSKHHLSGAKDPEVLMEKSNAMPKVYRTKNLYVYWSLMFL